MKFYHPEDNPPAKPGGYQAYDKAKEAAIEKKLSHYIELSCGHLTTWEDDMFWSFNRPARNKIWCDSCGKWKVRKPKPTPKVYPDTPLF